MSFDNNDRLGNSRLEGVQSIMDGKFDICRGLEDLCEALKDIRCGREYEAQLRLVEGIHKIKVGLCEIEKGLRQLRNVLDCEDRREIKEGIRLICRALEALCEVLKDVCCGNLREAERKLVKAIRDIEEGLCRIEKGIDDIFEC